MKNQYAAGVTPGLAFAVYYCGRDDIAFELRWCTSTVTLNRPEQSLSLCGTRMSSIQDIKTPPSGDATVACLLEVKGDLYALGPAHLLTRKDASKSQEQLLAELLQMDEDEDEDIAWEEDEKNDSDYDESDGGYASANDIISDKDTLNSDTTPPDSLSPSPQESTHDPRDEGVTVLFPGPDDLQEDNADGDWAVTLIQKPEQQLPNLYSVEQQISGQESPKQEAPKLRHIVEFASEPSKDDTEPIVERSVHILTSSSTKQGKLLPGFANISGLSARGHCNVHIVAIDESDSIVAGDSGSLVVDAQTSLAYGHVVATSPQGYAYIVPLYTTIRQMKAFFGTANVRLPEPLHLLSRVALHYVTTKHFCQAEEAVIALTDLVQDVCNSRQWERLALWIRISAARTNLLDIWDDKLAQLFSDKYENQSIRKWLTVTHAFRERFRAENLSVDEYRFTPHPKPFYDFASAVLPQILEELSAPYNTTLRSCRTCRHSRYDICVITPLLNSGPDGMTSNSSIIKAIITQLLSALNVTSSSRFTRRSELRRRFPFTGYPNGLQNLAVVLDIHLTLTVACSQIDLQRTNIVPFNERLEFLEPLTKGTLASVYRATSWCADAKGKIEIAVKKVSKSTTTVVQWLNEERILQQLQTYNDPHIVELLTSYCTLDSYALVFPLANGNMDQLMERDIRASSLELTATWVVKQIQGLAKALQYLHTGDEHTKIFGRHGDINPSNILWYNDTEEDGIPPLGTLKIADFGRSELRSLGERRPSIRKALCEETPLHCIDYSYGTYAAPECELPTSVCPDRRTSDIWSLGCVFLEFLIWTVEGAKEVRRLHQKLRSDVPGRGTSFWHLEVSTHQLLFSLNPPIKEYLERLSQYAKDNAKLRAAVDLLVYGGVLDPNPHERPTAKQLGEELRSISIEIVHDHTVAKRPVWTRLWTYTLVDPPQRRHTVMRNGYDSNIVFGTLLLPYPNMAGAAFLENEITIDSEHYQDMDDESLLHEL
ncbi:hypothetical protein J4E85_007811 [Alternaria conjuncta]|uniref:uncharacterized protein n=1 Tax=Alternaria conjuncta TaxID=181017 RepID=UPI00221F9D0F|nr:uncharacterized protein J4E85_007811 [Alternaria conjuncta]KAI4924694.1 hypothetical protein J4E85_007811 [Alternaria conjuncta]